MRTEVSENHIAIFSAEMKIEHSPLELELTYQAVQRHNGNTRSIISSVMYVVDSSVCKQIYNISMGLNCAILICHPLTNRKKIMEYF
jgi:hypothetical protein